jgi:hypothetical protein
VGGHFQALAGMPVFPLLSASGLFSVSPKLLRAAKGNRSFEIAWIEKVVNVSELGMDFRLVTTTPDRDSLQVLEYWVGRGMFQIL